MKGLSIPNISIPNISIPNISFSGNNIDTGSIKSAIGSALPDLKNLTDGIDLQSTASKMLSESGGINLPPELSELISK